MGLYLAEGGDLANPEPTKESFGQYHGKLNSSAYLMLCVEIKLSPTTDVTTLTGSLILKRWLFTKEQESQADTDATYTAMLYTLVLLRLSCSLC